MPPVLRARTRAPSTPTSTRRAIGKGKANRAAQPPKREPALQSQNPTKEKSVRDSKLPVQQSIATLPRPTRNPQATLLGLPAELRLEIYGHVFNSSLIHVHFCFGTVDGEPVFPHFTWTPCRATNPECPLFCANPKWSGLCDESERCTFKLDVPRIPTGPVALTWTCKFIRNETKESFLRNTTVSIHTSHVSEWLDDISRDAPRHLELLTRITLAAPDDFNMGRALYQIKKRVPNLQAIGYQGQVSMRQMGVMVPPATTWTTVDPRARWKKLHAIGAMKGFDRSITVAMEGLLWNNGPRIGEDEQTVFRIIREGKDAEDAMRNGLGWDDEDVEIESHTSKLVANKKSAEWRQWWRIEEVKQFMH